MAKMTNFGLHDRHHPFHYSQQPCSALAFFLQMTSLHLSLTSTIPNSEIFILSFYFKMKTSPTLKCYDVTFLEFFRLYIIFNLFCFVESVLYLTSASN